jgi:hypothetical protein
MTSRVIRMGEGHESPGKLKEIIISCDHMSCTTAVNDTTVAAGGGVRKMGWQALPQAGAMRHYCPEHNRAKGVRE